MTNDEKMNCCSFFKKIYVNAPNNCPCGPIPTQEKKICTERKILNLEKEEFCLHCDKWKKLD
jgi:hypothetical protein